MSSCEKFERDLPGSSTNKLIPRWTLAEEVDYFIHSKEEYYLERDIDILEGSETLTLPNSSSFFQFSQANFSRNKAVSYANGSIHGEPANQSSPKADLSTTEQGNPSNKSHLLDIKTDITSESPGHLTSTNTDAKFKSFQDAKTKYMNFMSQNTGNTFKELLVKALYEFPHQVTLDDFYNLLYNVKTPEQVVSTPVDGFRIDKSRPNGSSMVALYFFYLIIETLRQSNVGPSHSKMNQKLPSSSKLRKSKEICRYFLAMKILSNSVKVVENDPNSKYFIPRISVHKAYHVICQKLLYKYPSQSDFPKTQQDLHLNQSQLGKVFKLTFPQLESKRLGRRGDSTYHYQGVVWNCLLIDEELKLLIELPLLDIANKFKKLKDEISQTKHSGNEQVTSDTSNLGLDSVLSKDISRLKLSNRKPIYSFVYLSNTFPDAACFPRSWETTPGNVPHQSPWAKKVMERSVQALSKNNVDIQAAISKISGPVFCAETMDIFLEDVLLMIKGLMKVSAFEDIYLHLYLVVMTITFPMAFSSSKEVSRQNKFHLCSSLSNFVTRLDSVSMGYSSFCNLMGFSKTMKKMRDLTRFLLSQYRTSSTKSIIRAMIGDSSSFLSTDEKLLGDTVFREAFTAYSGFNWAMTDVKLDNNSIRQNILQNIVDAFLEFGKSGAENAMGIPDLMSDTDLKDPMYDLSYDIFKVMIKVFHEVFLTHSFIIQLPMKVIVSFLSSITKEFQNLSFQYVANRERELSKEIFKAWWVHLSAFQEYMDIISEITSLENRLS